MRFFFVNLLALRKKGSLQVFYSICFSFGVPFFVLLTTCGHLLGLTKPKYLPTPILIIVCDFNPKTILYNSKQIWIREGRKTSIHLAMVFILPG